MKKRAWMTILIAVFVLVLGISFKTEASTKISAPKISSKNIASTGKIKITWNKVSGAEKYQVYRATSKDGKYTRLSTTTKTSLTNTSAVAGKKYYYYVVAVSQKNVKSAKSNIVSRTCDLKRPSITLSNTASTGKIKISWEAVDKAVKYQVYRATSKSGTYKRISTTTKTSMTNTSAVSGKTYYYKVRAVASNTSANSAYSEIKSRACDLARPVVTVSLNSSGSPKLVWDKVENAVEYEVYRSMTSDGEYELIYTTKNNSMTNSNAPQGVKCYYKVRAIASKSSANSAYSKVVSVTPKLSDTSLKTRYVSEMQMYLYKLPDSNSDSLRIPYMSKVKLGCAVRGNDSGKWYRLYYNDKLYYTWIGTGESKFTSKKSSFDYVNEENTTYQNEVVELAATIYKEWETFYTHGQSNGVMNPDGTYGFDCSGLASYCLNTVMQKYVKAYKLTSNVGKLVNVDSVCNRGYDGYELKVKTIKLANIQPGDIIFFSQSSPNNHCGIYLGNNEFIHSSSYWDGVEISPLSGMYLDQVSVIKRFLPKEEIKELQKTMYTNGYCGIYSDKSCTSEFKIESLKPNACVTLLSTDSEKRGYIRYKSPDGLSVEGFIMLEKLSSSAEE